MCDKGLLEPDDLSDAIVAKHKGITIDEVRKRRLQGEARITSLISVHQYIEWALDNCRDNLPWSKSYNRPEVIKAVNKWCTRHWMFCVPELGWNIQRVALCVHRPTLQRFNAHVGKQIDWLKMLDLSKSAFKEIVSIFKST
jgi:hypothetical protein